MPSYLGALLGLIALFLLLALGREWLRYRSGEHFVTRGQMIARVVTTGVLIALLFVVGAGVQMRFTTVGGLFRYWAIAMLLAAIAIAFAMWDLRQTRRRARHQRAEAYSRLSHHIRQLERNRSAHEMGGQ